MMVDMFKSVFVMNLWIIRLKLKLMYELLSSVKKNVNLRMKCYEMYMKCVKKSMNCYLIINY